jgi:hypothetical protein
MAETPTGKSVAFVANSHGFGGSDKLRPVPIAVLPMLEGSNFTGGVKQCFIINDVIAADSFIDDRPWVFTTPRVLIHQVFVEYFYII